MLRWGYLWPDEISIFWTSSNDKIIKTIPFLQANQIFSENEKGVGSVEPFMGKS